MVGSRTGGQHFHNPFISAEEGCILGGIVARAEDTVGSTKILGVNRRHRQAGVASSLAGAPLIRAVPSQLFPVFPSDPRIPARLCADRSPKRAIASN